MVLKPAVIRLAATVAIAPEPASLRRARHAADKNRAKRLKTDPSLPHCFAFLSAGAAMFSDRPFHDLRSSLPSTHFGDIPSVENSGVTEPIRTVHRCLSLKPATCHVAAAGRGHVHTAIRLFRSRVRIVSFPMKSTSAIVVR